MTSTRDVQDMLGLPAQAAAPRPKPSKKGKSSGDRSKKGAEGSAWSKELKSLMGERAPPLPLSAGPKWKDKRSRMMGPVRKWRMTPFKNDARTDGLLLRHWKRVAEDQTVLVNGLHEKSEEYEQKQLDTQDSYRFSKYNQSVEAPQFTHEEYDEHLKNERWTEAETRYLMSLFSDFNGKWPLIADRYDWTPTSEEEEKNTQPKARRMEELKHRMFTVSGRVLALRTPQSQMTEAEYRDHELMMKYNPQVEVQRKQMKEKQMMRSQEEKKEEEYLLAELKRIYAHQERFDAELRELRTRIDHSLTDDKPGGASYTTSQELTQLFQRVTAQDKSKLATAQQKQASQQRRSLGGEGPQPSAGSPTAMTPGGSQKRQSISMQDSNVGIRTLTPRAEARFGVSTHDRLSSGVTFVSDKITKARAATKSTPQNQKIASILGELGVPEILQMQTPPVCEEMEKLCEMVVTLLKSRQATEKAEGERMVLVKQLEMQGLIKPGEYSSGQEEQKVEPDADGDVEVTQAQSAPSGETNEEHPIKTEEQDGVESAEQSGPTTRKRSASVMSAASAGSRGRARKGLKK